MSTTVIKTKMAQGKEDNCCKDPEVWYDQGFGMISQEARVPEESKSRGEGGGF